MASAESVKQSIAEAKGDLMTLTQQKDHSEWGFSAQDWADEMYLAWEMLGEAVKHIDRASDLE